MAGERLSHLLKLQEHGWWGGTTYVPLLGEIAEISGEPDDSGPDGLIADILLACLNYPHDLHAEIRRVLFQSYIEWAPWDKVDYGLDEQGRDRAEIVAPRLTDPADMARLITVQCLDVGAYDNEPNKPHFKIWYNCTYDVEHGECIEVKNWTPERSRHY